MTPAFAKLESACIARHPLAAIVLGSGLNSITDDWPLSHSVPFGELPDMPSTTIAGHKGRLCLHEFADCTVLVFQGRLHYYEGHSWDVVERPIRIAHDLGVRTMILTNAAGGIGPKQEAGSLMAIREHIAANRPDWWKWLASEWPKPDSPYSVRLNAILQASAADIGMDLPAGVYACVTGPNYETPAEVRALRAMGADAVGMSTVHEANVAATLGMEVAAISCIANQAAGLSATPLSHAEVLAVVQSAAERMGQLLQATLRRLIQKTLKSIRFPPRRATPLRISRPEWPILPAQAEGLGRVPMDASALKGPFIDFHRLAANDPFRVKSPYRLQSQASGLG